MGSSAQNSFGVHWCRRRVRFNEVPEKFRRFRRRYGRLWCRAGQVQQGSGEGSREGLGSFGAEPGQVPTRFRRRFWWRWSFEVCHRCLNSREALVQSQIKFNRVREGEVSGEGRGGFGAESGSTGFRRRSGRLWCRARSGFNRVPENVPVKVWEVLVQSQVRLDRVPEKVPGKVWEALVQSQVKFNRVPEKVLEALVQPGQVQQGSGEGSGEGLGGFGAARSGSTGFRRRFQRSTLQIDL